MKNKYIELIKNTAIFALGSIGSKLIVFLLVPLYTNHLTTEEYGTADLVFTVAQLIVPFVSLVIFDAVTRFGLENSEHPEKVLHNAIIIWLSGCIISLLALPLTNFYPSVGVWKWYLYAYIVLEGLLSIELNYLKVKNKNLNYAITCIIQTFCVAAFNILFLVCWNMKVEGYLLSTLLAMLIAVIIASLLGNVCRDFFSVKADRLLLKSMVLFSAPLVFNNLSWWIIQSSNKILIEYAVGAYALGLFTVATRIPSLINVVVSVFQQAWGISSVVEVSSTNDTDFFNTVFEMYTFLVFGACIALNSIIKPFMGIYVGAEFFESWIYVPVLVISAGFSSIAAYFGAMYGALKKSINSMVSTLLAAAINFIFNILLIYKIGVWGAVVGTAMSYMFLAFFRIIDVKRFINIKINFLRLVINCLVLFAHAILITVEYNVLMVSAIALGVYIILNINAVIPILRRIIKRGVRK